MRAFWVAVETLDLSVIRALTALDRALGRRSAAERAAAATEKVPEPTPAPKFEK